MNEPSEYELDAWDQVQGFTGRTMSRRMSEMGQKVAEASDAVGGRAKKLIEDLPRTSACVRRGQAAVSRSAQALNSGVRSAGAALPDWTSAVGPSAHRTTSRVARAGLSPKRIIAQHRERGHDVTTLRDLRGLDLEQIDAVRGRAAAWLYPAGAALSGAGAGLAISGGSLATVGTAGAASAPSGAVITTAFLSDAATVLGLGSRAAGRAALMHGYDPESPAEKLFILSVVNAGTAVSAGAKSAAFSDISKLTQALARDKTWAVLNESVVARVAGQFAKKFSFRLTKQGLGKALPAAGIVLGGTLNWATIEGIVDAADVAYRRRFLLEKYPHLAADDGFGAQLADQDGSGAEDLDQVISVTRQLAESGGPDLT